MTNPWEDDSLLVGGSAEQPPGEDIAKLLPYGSINTDLTDYDLVAGGILENRGVAALTGSPSAGKSWLAVDLAVAVASGTDWLGAPCRQGTVVFGAAEAADSIKNRFAAHKTTDRGKGDLPIHIIPHSVNLGVPQNASDLAYQLRRLKPSLVVIDTLSRSIVGVDENSVEQMGQVVDSLSELHHSTGALVLFTHHLGKNTLAGARGHSVLIANTDAELRTSFDRETKIFTLEVLRQRNRSSGQKVNFTLRTVNLGKTATGKPVDSCLIEVADAPPENDGSSKKEITIGDAMVRELNNMACNDAHRVAIPMGDGVPPSTYGVKKEAWKTRLFHTGIISSDLANPHSYFATQCSRLVKRQAIRIAGELIWVVQRV